MQKAETTDQPTKEPEPIIASEKTERLLTTLEAAYEIDRSPQQVGLLIMQGRLPARKRGRDWLIKESDLQLLMSITKDRPADTRNSQPGKSPSAAAGKIATALRRGGPARKGKG